MSDDLRQISARIRKLAAGALAQANTHAVFRDPKNEYWDAISVLNAAHAGELFIKSLIADEHPLLIFKDLFALNDNSATEIDVQTLLNRGRTHDFEKLPQVLWVTTGKRIPDLVCYEKLRKARNAIQHFCAPIETNFSELALEFIYKVIDPLINDHLGWFAIDFHEDHGVGYDYIVEGVVRAELKFSIPDDFELGEIDLVETLKDCSPNYKSWIKSELSAKSLSGLLSS